MKNSRYTIIVASFLLLSFFTMSQGAFAQGTPGGGAGSNNQTPGGGAGTNTTVINFKNPLSYDTVEAAVGSFLSYLQGVIVVLAMVFLVIGALFYLTSAGNEGRIETAKKAIFAAMIGLAIGVAAPSFLKEIYGILGQTAPSQVSAGLSLAQIALNVLNFLLGIVGTFAIIMLVVGGMMFLFAGGSEKQVETAKNIVKYSVIGILVALAALVIVKQIAAFF